jgi:hypothetical protein
MEPQIPSDYCISSLVSTISVRVAIQHGDSLSKLRAMAKSRFNAEVLAAAEAENPIGFAYADLTFDKASSEQLDQLGRFSWGSSLAVSGSGWSRRARRERSIAAGRTVGESSTEFGVRQFWATTRKLWRIMYPDVELPDDLKPREAKPCPKGTKPGAPKQSRPPFRHSPPPPPPPAPWPRKVARK